MPFHIGSDNCGSMTGFAFPHVMLPQSERKRWRPHAAQDELELADALAAALSKHAILTDHTSRLADAYELILRNDDDVILLDRRLADGVN